MTFDPDCYLCPGNVRANGNVNPRYDETYVFTNDFAALRPDTSIESIDDGLLRAEGERGSCRVVCFSPRHDLTLGRMEAGAVRRVVDVWAEQTAELGAEYRWVQVFENRGEAMGASNPHPHGQIWAGTALPGDGAREDASQRAHLASTGQRMLLDYVDRESGGQRVIVESDEWLTVVPFWAAWPFETLLIPRRPAARLTDLDDAARDDLATVAPRADRAIRRAVQAAVPVFDGLASGAIRRRRDRPLAGPRALLSAVAARQRAQVHGRLRAAGRDPARPHRRGCCRSVASGPAGRVTGRRLGDRRLDRRRSRPKPAIPSVVDGSGPVGR